MANRMHRAVSLCNKTPRRLRTWLVSTIIGRAVKMAGSTRLQIEQLSAQNSRVRIRNIKKNQNHIGSVHACATALAAESATGFLVGMNVPDSRIPVIKSMAIQFVRRSSGDITCRANLTAEQRERILTEEKGEVRVNCTVTDTTGAEPVKAEMVWAWTPKRRR